MKGVKHDAGGSAGSQARRHHGAELGATVERASKQSLPLGAFT